MSIENITLSPPEVEVILLTESPGSRLGQVVATTAALALLEKLHLQANYFLQWHEWSEGSALDRLNTAASQRTLTDAARVKSEYFTESGPVLVVTEAVTHDGAISVRTRLMLPNEV